MLPSPPLCINSVTAVLRVVRRRAIQLCKYIILIFIILQSTLVNFFRTVEENLQIFLCLQ